MTNFVTRVLQAGGSIHPLIIPAGLGTNGTGLFNPSVFADGDDLLVNVRHCQYTIYHAEKGKYEHQWGPLCYLCPEDDLTLTTTNYLCKMGDDLEIKEITKVDTSKLDVKPIWEFVGLEDARIIRWNDGKLYLCGVRRDTTTTGVGRMELSEIVDGKEVSRFRIPAPGKDDSYCEKNWVPVIDMPYHYVKWSNPTQIVKVDPVAKTCEEVFLGKRTEGIPYDFRGGSQVIPFGDYRISIAHVMTKFFKNEQGRKNAEYRHCFIVWDKDWNVVKYGDIFDFMGGSIEFCCGMTEYKGRFMITFGFQDNGAYLLEVPRSLIEEYVRVDRVELDMGTNTQITNEYMLREILHDNVYEKFFTVKNNDVVLDIGANVGIFPFSLRDRRPKRVICVEPSQGLVGALRKNLAQLPFPTEIIPAGMGKTSGFQSIGKDDYIFGDHNSNVFETITLKDLVSQCQLDYVDFMKIDCEGGEYSVFTETNYDYLTKNVGYISGEWHVYAIENGIEKFIEFANLYLKGKRNWRVFEPYIWKEVTHEVLVPGYVQRYYDWWVPRGTAAHFAVYIDNKGDTISW
jgi:FkbM family methyltransferase